jgi:hypothetical protein
VVKRYRSWDRGEPGREWARLTMLHQHARGISPQPLSRGCEDGAPVIEMARVPGEALGAAELSPAQVSAVAEALTRMHRAVPGEVLMHWPKRQWGPAEHTLLVRSWVRDTPPVACAPAPDALRAAAAWLDSADSGNLTGPLAERVFAQGTAISATSCGTASAVMSWISRTAGSATPHMR